MTAKEGIIAGAITITPRGTKEGALYASGSPESQSNGRNAWKDAWKPVVQMNSDNPVPTGPKDFKKTYHSNPLLPA
jgi:hypothetical protein